MHVGFFKSFTIPATTYFSMYHDRKKRNKMKVVARWSRLVAKAMEAAGISDAGGAFLGRLVGQAGSKFEGGETDKSYAAKRIKHAKAAE